jgi:MinD-like ATPase involved in chromosome partitioning or flagellar assembly
MSDGRIIGLVSGKGGVGKTSLAVNLCIGLKQQGAEVTVVDADFSASNLGVYLGRYDHPVKIQKVLHGEADVESAIFRHPTGVKAITSSNEINQVEPDTSELKDILNGAAEDSDYVLVDCPPGLDSTVENIMMACDELMIITMPTQTAGVNAAQIIEKAKEQRKPILGTILNKVEGDPEKELVEREVEMMTESHVMGKIPYDHIMKESLFENEPAILYEPLAEASIEIKKLAASLEGREYEPPKFAKLKRKLQEFKKNISS